MVGVAGVNVTTALAANAPSGQLAVALLSPEPTEPAVGGGGGVGGGVGVVPGPTTAPST